MFKKKVFRLQHNGRFQVLFKDGKIWLRRAATVTWHPVLGKASASIWPGSPVLERVPVANSYGWESNADPLPSRRPLHQGL